MPSVFLMMLLYYYLRHRWENPHKTYVRNIFKRNTKDTKTYKQNRFHRFHTSTSSVLKLLSFKREEKTKNIPENNSNTEEHIYETLDNNEVNFAKTKHCFYKVFNFNKNTNASTNQLFKDVNKIEVKDKVKPQTSDTDKKIVIINTGLTSTTNEKIGKEHIKTTIPIKNKTKSNALDINGSDTKKVQTNIGNGTKTVNPVKDLKSVIVNTGLASTTNEMIKNKIKGTNRMYEIKNNGLYDEVLGQKVQEFKKI